MSARKAPRRKVIEVERAGDWGHYVWKHHLECGHIERRRRQAPADRIGCVACLTPDYDVGDEVGLVLIKGQIAAHLGVPVDAIDLHTDAKEGRLRIRSATAFLTAFDVRRLATSRPSRRA